MTNTPAAESTFDYLRDLDIPEPSAEGWAAKLVNIELNRVRMIEAAEEIHVGHGVHLTVRSGEVRVRVEALDTDIDTHQLLGEIAYWIIDAAKHIDPDRPFRETREWVN
ncbi:MAG: hypothetical protein OXG74_11965 [Acidobacteria bacterium]|nr:hypothetical protein [Acidobacteriota bacterium]